MNLYFANIILRTADNSEPYKFSETPFQFIEADNHIDNLQELYVTEEENKSFMASTVEAMRWALGMWLN